MKIVIASTNFSPAFIGHMKAWYQAYEELGINVLLYFDEGYAKYFDKSKFNFSTNIDDVLKYSPEFAIIQNPGLQNMKFVNICKKIECKVIYILHEPYAGVKWVLSKKGNITKITLVSILNYKICKESHKVVLCSRNALDNFDRHMRKLINKRIYLPLLYVDQYVTNVERKYFSYIGGIGYDHAFDEFINFIKESADKNNIIFQIATRNNIDEYLDNEKIKKLIFENRLTVQHGRPLTEEEMNIAYGKSIAVWNGYRSSTQSGVIANAFMQGTPSIASNLKSFESLVIDGETGAIINNYDYNSIYTAYKKVERNNDILRNNCRNYFLNNFYYKAHLDTLKTLVSQ